MTTHIKSNTIRIADLDAHTSNPFDLTPSSKARKNIAAELGLTDLRKIRFSGSISALGKQDWELRGELGATVVQACVISFAPVVTRIDVPVSRQFLAQMAPIPDIDEEIEIPDNENAEPLGDQINLADIMFEALALALPAYPKAEDANLDQSTFAEDGITPMQDEDTRAFAGLATLRDKMKNNT